MRPPFSENIEETVRPQSSQNSKGIYNFNDYRNKILSSKIEKDYNILNVNILDDIIAEKIELTEIDSDMYIEKVIELLEIEKLKFNEQQRKK